VSLTIFRSEISFRPVNPALAYPSVAQSAVLAFVNLCKEAIFRELWEALTAIQWVEGNDRQAWESRNAKRT
jgi:hypothetical protein